MGSKDHDVPISHSVHEPPLSETYNRAPQWVHIRDRRSSKSVMRKVGIAPLQTTRAGSGMVGKEGICVRQFEQVHIHVYSNSPTISSSRDFGTTQAAEARSSTHRQRVNESVHEGRMPKQRVTTPPETEPWTEQEGGGCRPSGLVASIASADVAVEKGKSATERGFPLFGVSQYRLVLFASISSFYRCQLRYRRWCHTPTGL